MKLTIPELKLLRIANFFALNVLPKDRGQKTVIRMITLLLTFGVGSVFAADQIPRQDVAAAMKKATEFFSTKVASHGGYVYRYSADLAKREGEGKTGLDTVWVQPPGTPSVGLAFVEAYERSGETFLLDAAKSAADCLIRGQLRSGGWNASIEFDPAERKRLAYRVDTGEKKKNPFNVTSFDDDKSQSAMRFLMRLDQTLKFQDERIHEAITFALESVIKSQFPNGGWPQGYAEFPDPRAYPVKKASFPESWPRAPVEKDYYKFYTLNDNALADTIDVMLLAATIYNDPKYRRAAERAGDFLILAQLPDPQPAWAQQYDFDMHPSWARKFEPPSITGLESQGAMQALMRLYVATGDRKFLEPIPRAVAYLRKSALPNGQLARFYELKTNKPLYFTKQYELTYDDSDMPTHYGFQVGSKLDEIEREHNQLSQASADELAALRDPPKKRPGRPSPSLTADTRKAIESLDNRGAWVESGKLTYHGKGDETKQIIDSRTFAKNLKTLSRYLEASR